jgi:Xaa-Pro aminopeptidase
VAVRVITEGLVRLGLLCGDVDYLIKNELYKKFFPHRTSHWLGLDVHDVGDYKVNDKWRILQPGMVLTVEPGIYVQPDDMSVDEKWRGIGIRIEDDILVTEDGYEVLSAAAPKEIYEIETLMRG